METYSILTQGRLRFLMVENGHRCEMPPRSFDETSGLLLHYQSTGADHIFQAPYGIMNINNQDVIHRRHAALDWHNARIILAAGKGSCHMAVEKSDVFYSLESFAPVPRDAMKEFVYSYNICPSYSSECVKYSHVEKSKSKLVNYDYIYT